MNDKEVKGSFHILIHFKIPIHRAPGSTEFDLSWYHPTTQSLKKVLDDYISFNVVGLENRKINPFNIRSISICKTERPASEIVKTPGKHSEIFHLLNIVARKEKGESVWYYDSKKESEYKKERKYPTIEGLTIEPNKKGKPRLKFKHIIKSVIWYIAPAISAVGAVGVGAYIFHSTNPEAYLSQVS